MEDKNLFLIYLGKTGAGPKLTLDFSKEIISDNKIENFNLLISKNNLLKEEILSLKLDTFLLNTPSSKKETLFKLPKFIFNFSKIILKSKKNNTKNFFFMMTHPWNIFTMILIKIFIKKSNIIYVCHAYDYPTRSFKDFIEKINIKIECLLANKIITLSSQVKNEIASSINKKNISTLYHPLFNHERIINKKELSNNPTFLLFGRILKYKGLEILIPAFEKLSEENKNVRLIIAGEGQIEEKETKLIENINQKYNNIILKNNYVEEKDVDNIWRESDISITPYLNSLQSGVIPIAINKATPSIITPHNALMEQCFINTENPVALCAKDISTDSLLKVMKEILNKETYSNLSENCIYVQKELSWSSFLDKVIVLLK